MSASVSEGMAEHNLLLRSLPEADLKRILPQLKVVLLPLRTILVEQNERIDSVYFVQSGTVSMISHLQNGEQVEVGLVGNEGMVGVSLLLGEPITPLEGLVQVAGSALSISGTALHALLAELPSLLRVLLRYVDAFHVQVVQSAACNGHHKIEQRLARWILMTHDRVQGDTFVITQEFMSHMLGAQRPGVTLAVGTLQQAGLIHHAKGIMKVLDRSGLEAAACECYDVVQRRMEWLTGQRDRK